MITSFCNERLHSEFARDNLFIRLKQSVLNGGLYRMEVGGNKLSPIYEKRLYISLSQGLLNHMNARQHHREKGGLQNNEQE